METLTIDLKKKKSFEIGQQGDHNALCIHFINMKNVGTNKKYIYYTIDGIENCVPLTNDRFIVGYPLTAHSGIASAQLISKLNDNSIIKLSNVFAMNIKESKGYKDSGEYPVDPNIQSSYDLLDDLIDQTQDLINNYNYATLMEKLTQASSEATTSATTAKKCADELKSSTDFINTLDDKVAAQDSKIEKIEASTNHITTKQNTKIAALQTRMSEFTSLKDGSTTGDAELIDARIGADGTKYSSAGDAMRDQVEKLNEALVKQTLNVRGYLNSETDLNTITDIGIYQLSGNAINMPESGDTYYIYVIRQLNATALMQIVCSFGGNVYTRVSFNSGTEWSTWNDLRKLKNGSVDANAIVDNSAFKSFSYLSEATDLNNQIITGLYQYSNTAINAPECGDTYHLYVYRIYGADLIFQYVVGTSANLYFRFSWNQGLVWNEWVNLRLPKDDTITLNKLKLSEFIKYCDIRLFENFGVIGDSFSVGAIAGKDGEFVVTGKDFSWGKLISNKYGNNFLDLSFSGLSTRTWLISEHGLSKMLSSPKQDLYLIKLEINDLNYLQSEPNYLGELSDIHENSDTNPNTYYGNYGKIIAKIKEYAPSAKIILITAPWHSDNYAKFNNAIIEIGNKFNLPVLKEYEDEYFKSEYYNTHFSSNHPTAPLYVGMADAYDRMISKCIYDNIDYFQYIYTE